MASANDDYLNALWALEQEPTVEARLWDEIENALAVAAGSIEEDFLNHDLPTYAVELFQPHRYKVLYGGRGAGRSWSVARALLLRASRQKLRVLCTRELQTSIKDSVHQLLQDQIALLGLKGFTVVDREIRHTNGSLFIFEGLRHNITKIKSIEGIDICWVEEAERISENSWRVLVPTIRRAGSEIWVTFNPDLETDPTYKRFVLNPPPTAWVKKVGWEDNPWFPAELRTEMEWDYATDPDAAEHVWGGETRHASEAQILRGKWRVEEFEPEVTWEGPYQGIDFGFGADPATLLRVWRAPIKEHPGRYDLMIEHEAYRHHLDLDETAEFFEACVPGCTELVTRADSSRPESISYLKKPRGDQPHFPHILPCTKWPGSVEDGIAHLRGYRHIVIHPRCRHTKDEAHNYSYKVDEKTGDILPIVVDKHNHCIDAIRYALDRIIRLKARSPDSRRRRGNSHTTTNMGM